MRAFLLVAIAATLALPFASANEWIPASHCRDVEYTSVGAACRTAVGEVNGQLSPYDDEYKYVYDSVFCIVTPGYPCP